MIQNVAPVFPPGTSDHDRHVISAKWHIEAAAKWHLQAALSLIGPHRLAELVAEAFDATNA